MSTPWADVVAAVRAAGNRAGSLKLRAWTKALVETKPLDGPAAAYTLARASVGPSVDTASVRELETELAAMSEGPRGLACVLAPALAKLPEELAVVQRALAGIAAASSAALGAWVPWSIAVDATLLEACRSAGAAWSADRLVGGERDRAEELARRVARALGVPVVGKRGPETSEQSAERLATLDLDRMRALAQQNQVEQAIRATLPKL